MPSCVLGSNLMWWSILLVVPKDPPLKQCLPDTCLVVLKVKVLTQDSILLSYREQGQGYHVCCFKESLSFSVLFVLKFSWKKGQAKSVPFLVEFITVYIYLLDSTDKLSLIMFVPALIVNASGLIEERSEAGKL